MAADNRVSDILNMSSLGDRLRQAREGKNVTLGQVQKQTRIHQEVLKAMEDGKCDSILNPTYVKSFLKKYCEYLGMDSRSILDEYKKLHPGEEASVVHRLPASLLDHKALPKREPPFKSIAFMLVVIALIAFGVLKGAHYIKRPVAEKGAKVSKAVPRAAGAAKVSKKAPSVSAGPAKGAGILVPKDVPLKLLMKVNQTVFIKMKTDGVLLFERSLTKGTAEVFTANNSINIYAANGAAVELYLNGKSIGRFKKGVQRNIEITRSGVRLI